MLVFFNFLIHLSINSFATTDGHPFLSLPWSLLQPSRNNWCHFVITLSLIIQYTKSLPKKSHYNSVCIFVHTVHKVHDECLLHYSSLPTKISNNCFAINGIFNVAVILNNSIRTKTGWPTFLTLPDICCDSCSKITTQTSPCTRQKQNLLSEQLLYI